MTADMHLGGKEMMKKSDKKPLKEKGIGKKQLIKLLNKASQPIKKSEKGES